MSDFSRVARNTAITFRDTGFRHMRAILKAAKQRSAELSRILNFLAFLYTTSSD
jgi:hypothetical protein